MQGTDGDCFGQLVDVVGQTGVIVRVIVFCGCGRVIFVIFLLFLVFLLSPEVKLNLNLWVTICNIIACILPNISPLDLCV